MESIVLKIKRNGGVENVEIKTYTTTVRKYY